MNSQTLTCCSRFAPMTCWLKLAFSVSVGAYMLIVLYMRAVGQYISTHQRLSQHSLCLWLTQNWSETQPSFGRHMCWQQHTGICSSNVSSMNLKGPAICLVRSTFFAIVCYSIDPGYAPSQLDINPQPNPTLQQNCSCLCYVL